MATVTAREPRAITTAPKAGEMTVYMHTALLYWWPVWVVGYLMAGWTVLENHHMALVPDGAVLQGNAVVAPDGPPPVLTAAHVSASRIPGMAFALTLLGVLALGSGWIRGWRAYTFAGAVAAALLLVSWLQWWGDLARWASYLHVHINLGGYLVVSTGLLALWLVQVYVVDRRTYVTFSMSQVRVHNEIGEEERAYDTAGMELEKAPYDWFRWLVGCGAGDLRVKVGGQWLEIPNVIHLGRRLRAIETLMRVKDVE